MNVIRIQGGPSGRGHAFVDFAFALVKEVYNVAELSILCQQTVFRNQMDHPVHMCTSAFRLTAAKLTDVKQLPELGRS